MVENSLHNQGFNMIPVVFFGRLEERKGLCTFVKAVQNLSSNLKDKIHLIFMGKIVPLYSAELKHLNSEEYLKLELENQINYEIISNFYSQQAIEYIRNLNHAIVCLTSPQENFPNTALEMGQLPVSLVVSDTGGFRETLQLVKRTEGLYWFKPKDVDSLKEKLEEALKYYPETPKVTEKSVLENINQVLLQEKIAYIEKAFEAIKPLEKSDKKVTLGIISHNQGEYLIDCLSCIEAQTYQHLEVIIIDNKSPNPDSQDLFIHTQSLFPNFKFIQLEKNQGIGIVKNYLLEISTGDYFLAFNPQVRLFPMAIEKFMEAASNSQASIITCAQKEIGAVDRIITYSGGTLPTMMKENVYGGECCLFSKELLQQFKHTEDKEINTQNWEILCAALVTGEKIIYYPYPLYEYMVISESYNSQEISTKAKYSLRQYLAEIPPQKWTKRQIYMLMTAIQQLQDLPSQISNLQWQLNQKGEELHKTATEVHLLNEKLHYANVKILEYEDYISSLKNNQIQDEQGIMYIDENKIQTQKREIENQLQEAKDRIAAMESSKFWNLRKKWFTFKKTFGLSTEE